MCYRDKYSWNDTITWEGIGEMVHVISTSICEMVHVISTRIYDTPGMVQNTQEGTLTDRCVSVSSGAN